ncbi:CsbD family protein [Enterococcus gallinarum]|uniref:CsbD family protein n=2 Tax=Enterococcus TaxID=1350 RepID=A0A6A8NGS6_ENTFC|nr:MULTISPECIES: CsbD family protein [Enterococcus]MBD9707656.1 CsbD family protein [Enterococcus faecium]MDN3168405.1 CsbD family protein [Enterococcus faecalis]MDT2681369.1 CsbD family protein [Enterococcus gallinarum]MDT2691983.1 CsbD family protein [Enterococcus gallinarum]MTD23371.1 CsbD family protein [Enterococcus faecium]
MTDKGTTDKIKGKAKEVAGDVTNDKETKAEGLLDQAIGKVKEVASDVKEKTEEVVEDVKDKLDKK